MTNLIGSLYVLWCRLRHKRQGLFLVEMTASLMICAVLAALVCTGAGSCYRSWQTLQEQIELQQAGSYMQGTLEKHFGYNALSIWLAGDGKVSYQSLLGSKSYAVYPANNGLYLRTSTPIGDGVNPLFIEGLPVSDWQARRLDGKRLLLSFTLHGKRGARAFTQIITCYNGEIYADGEK